MGIDNDNSDYEAKRAEQRRQIAKQQAKEMHEKNPMRSFEAKLAKDVSREDAKREALSRTQHEVKKDLEEKGNVLKRILGDKASDSLADLTSKAKQHEDAFYQQKSLQKKVAGDKLEKKDNEDDQDEFNAERAEHTPETQDAKQDERIIGILDEHASQEGQSFAGGGGSFSDDAQQQDSAAFSGTEDESALMPQSKNQAVFGGGAGLSQEFGSSASGFSEDDFDQLIAQVQHSFLGNGDELFSVQLKNDFFDGLKIEAQRLPTGVVLTLVCPNVLVRTQLAKTKDEILKRFAAKNIQVHEVKFR